MLEFLSLGASGAVDGMSEIVAHIDGCLIVFFCDTIHFIHCFLRDDHNRRAKLSIDLR